MRQSMTGFASKTGSDLGYGWSWELRGVNARGLDIRLRLPDWIEGLEPAVRKALSARVSRGSVQVGLRIAADAEDAAMRLDEAQLDAVLRAMSRIEAEAMAAGLSLAPSTAADIVGLRGILTSDPAAADPAALRAAVLADFEAALDAFVAARAEEGRALDTIITRQLGEIETLVADATVAVATRTDQQQERLSAQLSRVTANTDGIHPERITQELALIAVKSDVTEELDRLGAHVEAGRTLLAETGPIGRKLDFLCQEFNREANTLCSKSGDGRLTQIGLDLKTVIDQMREQVQNVE